jgi:hypothetical protein
VALARAYEENRARNADLVDQAELVLAGLDQAGMPTVPLKGIDAVFADLYGDAAVRTMGDLDVLVPADAATRAAAVLDDLGYRPAGTAPPDHHHLPALGLPGRVGVVELHTALQPPGDPRTLDAASVLERARPHPRRPGLRMDRTDAATHLITHAQARVTSNHRVALELRALHETALVVERVPEVDWEVVRERFRRAGLVARFDAHLAVAAELFDVPVPVAVGPTGRRAARLALVLADHPVLAVLDRPGRRLAVLRRERLERYYEDTFPGAAVWRARARYLGEVTVQRRALAAEANAPAADRP